MYQTLELTPTSDGVVRVTLARPEKHNALSAEMIRELTRAAQLLAADRDVRVVVLAAQGRSFCAGGDLGWMREQFESDAETRAAEARKLAEMLEQLDQLPKPLIARVQGNAFGGGIGLMAVCDAVVATEEARFALTETRLGLVPATIGPYVATRVGSAAARRYLGSGRPFSAEQACQMGLVSEAVPEADLDAAMDAEIAPWLHCAPGAVAATKALLRSMSVAAPETLRGLTEAALAERWASDEAHAGVGAFFAKTTPPWQGKRR